MLSWSAAHTRMVKTLLIRAPEGRSQTVRLEGSRVSVGRATSNELCFADDAGLSRQHLVFERDGDEWVVADLGSKNGTEVNGERIPCPHRLQPGDRITAGHLVMVFDDPLGGMAESVVFVDPTVADVPASTAMIANLDGVLGSEPVFVETASPSPFDLDIRVRALVHAGRELAGHRPLGELFPLILDLALDAVDADRGVLLTLEGERLLVRAARGDSFRISSAVRDRVVQQRESLLVEDVQREDAFRSRKSIQAQNVRSMLAVPLQTSERVIGLIYVDSPNVVRQFSREDLNLLTVMANVAAIRIEHARLADVEQVERILARELEQAAEIQRRLLPENPPPVSGLELAGHNAPCRTVGGDYYDFFPQPDGRVGLAVADVSGKGMPAALLMSSLHAFMQVLAEDLSDLSRLTNRLNRLLTARSLSNRFVSLFLGIVDPASGELAYCNAGHNPPLLVRACGNIEWLDGGGPILGVFPDTVYEQHARLIAPGDTLVLYSDGVTEITSPSGEEYGEDRLAALMVERRGRPAPAIVDDLRNALIEWTAGAPPADDVTLVVARRTSPI